jgi:predicted Rossmann fold flavoprotein
LYNIFNRFSADDTIKFFNKLSVKFKTEKDGRVFPITDISSTIVDALSKELSQRKVKVYINERIIKLILEKGGWQVKTDKNIYETKSVIITTGGKSYPESGSTGDGYNISRQFGHRIIEPRPAVVPIELVSNWYKDLQGAQTNVEVSLNTSKNKNSRRSGEMLFTHFGISGPVVLDLSRMINNVNTIAVNFLPQYKNSNELQKFLNMQRTKHPRKILLNSMAELLLKKLCSVLLYELKLNKDKQISQMKRQEWQIIADRLTKWRLDIKGPRSFNESMVTAGGVPMDEISPKTMESLKAKGLFFAGEILDIDGVSGGYNLQFAWSSGYIAGMSA